MSLLAMDDLLTAVVSVSTSGDTTIISDPGDGKQIAIDFITLNPDGGAQTIGFKNCVPGGTTISFILNDNQPLTFENAIRHPRGILTVNDSAAFVLNLSASQSVTGFIRYRILGQ